MPNESPGRRVALVLVCRPRPSRRRCAAALGDAIERQPEVEDFLRQDVAPSGPALRFDPREHPGR